MTPADIIQAAKMDGVMLSLSTTGGIKASGDGTALDRWIAIIRERKPELVTALGAGAGEQDAPGQANEPAPEADLFLERRDKLCWAGLNQDDAGLMAWKLERRDVEGDERRLCIECRHLSGGAESWRCGQWRKRQIISPSIPDDLVTAVLHRCGGFTETTPCNTQ